MQKITQEQFKKLEELICDPDNVHPPKTKPYCYQDKIVFTDGAVMLLISAEFFYHNYLTDHYDFSVVWKDKKLESIILINQQIFNEKINTIPTDPVYKEEKVACEECGGDGICICSCCNNEHHCGHCEGEGKRIIKKTKIGEVPSYRYCIKIGSSFYAAKQVKRIVDILAILGIQENLEVEEMKDEISGYSNLKIKFPHVEFYLCSLSGPYSEVVEL